MAILVDSIGTAKEGSDVSVVRSLQELTIPGLLLSLMVHRMLRKAVAGKRVMNGAFSLLLCWGGIQSQTGKFAMTVDWEVLHNKPAFSKHQAFSQ